MALAAAPSLRLSGQALTAKSQPMTCRLHSRTVFPGSRGLTVTCSAQEHRSLAEKLALPAAAVLSAALLFAATPEDALAARSGGRMGGGSVSSRPRR